MLLFLREKEKYIKHNSVLKTLIPNTSGMLLTQNFLNTSSVILLTELFIGNLKYITLKKYYVLILRMNMCL